MNKTIQLLSSLAIGGAAFFLSSCGNMSTTTSGSSFSFDPPAKQPTNPSAVKIHISTGAGKLYVTEGNEVLLGHALRGGDQRHADSGGHPPHSFEDPLPAPPEQSGSRVSDDLLDVVLQGVLRHALGVCETVSVHPRLCPPAAQRRAQDFRHDAGRHAGDRVFLATVGFHDRGPASPSGRRSSSQSSGFPT